MDSRLRASGLGFTPDFAKRGGLLPVIVQEKASGDILMLSYANEAALAALVKTLEVGKATFWRTSRNTLWTKGDTSEEYLAIMEVRVDCDQDALLYIVERLGAGACHTRDAQGNTRLSCFYRKVDSLQELSWVYPGDQVGS